VQITSWRFQIKLIALGYAVVSVVAAALLFGRHLQELKYPADASGGMWAFGDALLYIFIAFLFMVPTGFLIWATAQFESWYMGYSIFLLGLSLSSPVCLIVLNAGGNHVGEGVINICFSRLMLSPFILVGMGISRLVARFDRARRLVSYSLLVEGLTLIVAIALVVHAWGGAGKR
jgi:hypothetical protein